MDCLSRSSVSTYVLSSPMLATCSALFQHFAKSKEESAKDIVRLTKKGIINSSTKAIKLFFNPALYFFSSGFVINFAKQIAKATIDKIGPTI